MPPIDVDPETFSAASKIFGGYIATDIFNAWSPLLAALQSTGEMAGSDPAGTKWAASYDPAATATAAAITDLGNANVQLAALLEKTGFNHGLVESASDPTRSVPSPPDRTQYVVSGPAPVCYMQVPSASGGSGSAPHGWGLIEHAVGYVWPNGHQDKLRAAASAWRTASTSIGDTSFYVPEALEAIAYQKSPEVADATTTCNAMKGHISAVSDACDGLAKGCDDFAHYIDQCHSDVEGELRSLVEWTIGIEAAGGLFSVVTFGGSEAAAQAAEATRIAVTAGRVGNMIARLIELAGTVAETVATVVTRIGEVCQRLKVILGARLTEATANIVARLPVIGRTSEGLAEAGLIEAGEISDAEQTAYDAYKAAKLKKGLPVKSFEDWQKAVAKWKGLNLQGAAYRDAVAKDLGITPGEAGWAKEVYFPTSSGKRFFDLANATTKEAIEVKSGGSSADTMLQIAKDEEAVRKGWTVTWVLKTKLNPAEMARLQELAAKYPGRFSYITGP